MIRVRGTLLVGILAIGCGRIGFDTSAADASQADSALPPGAVLHLPFTDPPIGGAVQDVAAGHTVSCSPCPSLVPGVRGNAYRFDPSREHNLQAPFTADLDPSTGFTIAIWVRITKLPTQMYTGFLSKPAGNGASNSYGLYVDQAGGVLFHTGDTVVTDNLTGSTLAIGEWHHLAMTWDGVTKRGYIDGVPDVARAVSIASDGSPIVVGADLNGGTPAYGMDGDLDEAVVWSRALDPTEIEQLTR